MASRIAAACFILGYLPGRIWAGVLLPDLGLIQRLFVSITLSAAQLASSLYLGSAVLGVPVDALHAYAWAFVWILLGLAPRFQRIARRVLLDRVAQR